MIEESGVRIVSDRQSGQAFKEGHENDQRYGKRQGQPYRFALALPVEQSILLQSASPTPFLCVGLSPAHSDWIDSDKNQVRRSVSSIQFSIRLAVATSLCSSQIS